VGVRTHGLPTIGVKDFGSGLTKQPVQALSLRPTRARSIRASCCELFLAIRPTGQTPRPS
jgi:hypothetical protein